MLEIGVENYDAEVIENLRKRIEDYNSLIRKYETFLAKSQKAQNMVDIGTFANELEDKKNNRGMSLIRDILQPDEFFEKYLITSLDHCYSLKESYVFDNMLGEYFEK